MSDLEELRSASPPRSDELAAKFSRRIEPTIGFVVYGSFGVLVTGVLVMFGLVGGFALGGSHSTVTPVAVGLMFSAVAATVQWWLFFLWVRGRRRRARETARDGVVVDGIVEQSPFGHYDGAEMSTVIAFEHAGQPWIATTSYLRSPATGTKIPVLFRPSGDYGMVFDRRGRAKTVAIRRWVRTPHAAP